ncbi:MAG TPA: FAD-dependent oxidoreductase [Candidatus Dietzia merdigallinarum]|nr:FAD-dependent oxidoreductase [Candidatus Dietzia merdigallinarum]
MHKDEWDTVVDLLVVGSGAGGMTAAIAGASHGLSTLIVEKADVYGGNTALSGGGIWIPNNPVLAQQGITDPDESVMAYLRSIVGPHGDEDRLSAYVRQGPQVLAQLMELSRHMRFIWCRGYSDYHPENPGGRPEGRSVEPAPFDLRELGAEAADLRKAELAVPAGMWMTQREFRDVNLVMRTWTGKKMAIKTGWRMITGKLGLNRTVALGTALVARLRLVLRDLGVPLWLETPLTSLITDDDGNVVGAEVQRGSRTHRIRAVRGVVIASGGFEHDPVMRSRYLPEGGSANFSAGSPSNTGDGIRAGLDAGAAVDLMDDAWWMPALELPNGTRLCLVSERSIPRQIIVDQTGERFTNEAAPYVTFVHKVLGGGHGPLWFLTDHVAKKRYQFGGIMPGQAFPQEWYDAGMVVRAESLHELAEKTGLPADAVERSVRRFNQNARAGQDPDFHRGESAYDRYYGDDSLPHPVLDVIDSGPYYAVRIVAGDLGTKGGLRCDASSRVVRDDGSVIGGLYATGNSSAAVMGNDYAGPGATIGPAMVFGWIAATTAAATAAGPVWQRNHIAAAPSFETQSVTGASREDQ